MSLHIRLQTNYWTHIKTVRLVAAIGNDGFWIPPRLWAYAAENQPDGCFGHYAPEEIAMLIGYAGNAQAMLQAMLKAGFMDSDPLRIHDWDFHNSYHSAFAERARNAAKARWKRPRGGGKDKTRQDKIRQEASIASGNAQAMLEQIYSEYPKKVGKQAAIKAIKSALKAQSHAVLLEKVKAFASAVAEWPADQTQFIPHPATWFNRGSYDDDPQMWVKTSNGNGAPAKPQSTWELTKVIESKRAHMKELKDRFYSHTAMGGFWDNASKQAEFKCESDEVKVLEEQMRQKGVAL